MQTITRLPHTTPADPSWRRSSSVAIRRIVRTTLSAPLRFVRLLWHLIPDSTAPVSAIAVHREQLRAEAHLGAAGVSPRSWPADRSVRRTQ